MYMNTNLAVPREAESALADENEALARLYAGQSLTQEEAETLFASLVEGRMAEPAIAAMLIALKLKGESADELIGAARALRAACLPFDRPAYPFADSCGTGGDGAGTINLSTAVAFVAAAAGLPVAKHGNRSVTSRCGSADVLEQLGVKLDCSAEVSRRALDEAGLCFLFAPLYHPGLRHAGPVRRALGIRTIMNILGPCVNPAEPRVQLLNIGTEEMKGTDELKAAAAILRGSTHLHMRFDGFIEGDKLSRGTVDVIVTDGFSGNIALKSLEGTARFVTDLLRRAFTSSVRSKIGFLISRPATELLRHHLDPNNHNGAVFLGLNGLVVKSHGGATDKGVANAIRVAARMVREDITRKITEDLAKVSAKGAELVAAK